MANLGLTIILSLTSLSKRRTKMKIKLLHCKTINRNLTANHRQNKEPTKKSETLSDAPYLREHTHTHTHTHKLKQRKSYD